MDELTEGMRRQYERLKQRGDFKPEDRIWWIYLRAEVEKVVVRHNLPELQAAYNRVKNFPENLPDERIRWLELQQAVDKALQTRR